VKDTRPYVRANTFAALAAFGARCGNGEPERRALADDPSEAVRSAAAMLIKRKTASPDDTHALEKCAASDHSGAVAHRCLVAITAPERTHPALVYVIGEGTTTPHAHSAYALELADGSIHVGTSDRRGAVFDPGAPEGEVSLRRASALTR
jgi:hypothetical protein